MTVREYVGARYVPVFMGDWDIDADYEPLSIVSYQGNSYTSRQAVPHGVEITNTAYWAVTGNYNAQVEAYRQEVLAYEARITAIDTALPIEDYNENATVTDALAEKAFSFETVADMKAAENLFAGAICHTNGFYTSGDGGAAWYVIIDAGTANEMDVIACGELLANLVVVDGYVLPEMLGAYGDGVHDDSLSFDRALFLSYKLMGNENKEYLVKANTVAKPDSLSQEYDDSYNYSLYFYHPVTIKNVKFVIDTSVNFYSFFANAFTDGSKSISNVLIENCDFVWNGIMQSQETSNRMILIRNAYDASQNGLKNVTINGCYFEWSSDCVIYSRYCDNVNVMNNVFKYTGSNNDNTAVNIGSAGYCKINDNYFFGQLDLTESPDLNSYYGICGVEVRTDNEIECAGNTFSGILGGIDIAGFSKNGKTFVHDNTFTNCLRDISLWSENDTLGDVYIGNNTSVKEIDLSLFPTQQWGFITTRKESTEAQFNSLENIFVTNNTIIGNLQNYDNVSVNSCAIQIQFQKPSKKIIIQSNRIFNYPVYLLHFGNNVSAESSLIDCQGIFIENNTFNFVGNNNQYRGKSIVWNRTNGEIVINGNSFKYLGSGCVYGVTYMVSPCIFPGADKYKGTNKFIDMVSYELMKDNKLFETVGIWQPKNIVSCTNSLVEICTKAGKNQDGNATVQNTLIDGDMNVYQDQSNVNRVFIPVLDNESCGYITNTDANLIADGNYISIAPGVVNLYTA